MSQGTRNGYLRHRNLKEFLFTPYFEVPNNIHTISLIRTAFSVDDVHLTLALFDYLSSFALSLNLCFLPRFTSTKSFPNPSLF